MILIRILRGVLSIFSRVKTHIVGNYGHHYLEDLSLGSDELNFHCTHIFKYSLIFFIADKNFNLRTPSVNVVAPSVRKPLSTSSKGSPQNRRFNSGKYFSSIIYN